MQYRDRTGRNIFHWEDAAKFHKHLRLRVPDEVEETIRMTVFDRKAGIIRQGSTDTQHPKFHNVVRSNPGSDCFTLQTIIAERRPVFIS